MLLLLAASLSNFIYSFMHITYRVSECSGDDQSEKGETSSAQLHKSVFSFWTFSLIYWTLWNISLNESMQDCFKMTGCLNSLLLVVLQLWKV